MIRKLKLKFVIIIMTIVTIMITTIICAVYSFAKDNLERENVRMMTGLISPEDFRQDFPGRGPRAPKIPYFSFDEDESGTITPSGTELIDFNDAALIAQLYQQANSRPEPSGTISDHHFRYMKYESGIIFIDASMEYNVLKNLLIQCIYIGFGSFVVFLIISILLARWAVKPVDASIKAQKQFIADASHELKTPLTVIMTNAEMLQDEKYSQEKKADFSRNILNTSQKMKGLVLELLDMARSDSEIPSQSFDSLDFSELLSNTTLLFEPLYYEQNLQIESEITDSLFVKGNSEQLSRLVTILLDNAQKYSDPGSTVQVLLMPVKHQKLLLSVANNGPHISKGDLKNIFQRFYQLDQSRSQNHSYGLGLSIAKNICESHKGKIWAESEKGINTFYVHLPMIK